ncbi:hypothetical protein P879_09709 [Paragonimus westermani]|uniref:Uncharacterized protein n=1 Tax=Paragonimus westermani TaxID=34504 RepID=A0A8T0DDY3_9TREM|nr:hypothetical protein P879_09709 [Paragonimus westermani]
MCSSSSLCDLPRPLFPTLVPHICDHQGDFTHGVQQFRPPAPSAHLGGGDYVVSGSAYAALNQQLSGLTFEPGIAVGQPQGYVFQPINMQDGSYRDGYAPQMRGRGGRGRGNRGRPF